LSIATTKYNRNAFGTRLQTQQHC